MKHELRSCSARRRRDRQHLLGSRPEGVQGPGRVRRSQARGHRADPVGGAGLRGHGIRVNAICPGIIDTEMMDRFTGGTPEGRQRVIDQEPIGRMGTPEEIADAVRVGLLGRRWLCRRTRDGRRRRPDRLSSRTTPPATPPAKEP